MIFRKKMLIAGLAGCLLVCAAPGWGQDTSDMSGSGAPDLSDLKIRPFGKGFIEFGQIIKGQYAWASYPVGKLEKYWNQKAGMRLGLSLEKDNGFGLILSCEGALYFPYSLPGDGSGFGFEYLGPRFKFLPDHFEASYSPRIGESQSFKLGIGFFPYKYNPDGTNFGDYLYRLNSYPQYLPTHFDSPYQRLLGIRVNGKPHESVVIDAMLTSEVYLWPLRDFSPSVVVRYSPVKLFEIGGGIIWHRLISVDHRLTTPPKGEQDMLDSVARFSFASTRAVIRAAIDPKAILPGKEIFGKNDLRVYGEICFNGLKNYPIVDTANSLYPGYDKLSKRTLILIGFNVPTFKILDALSVEAEWWDNDFANSYWGAYPTGGGYKQNPNPWKYAARGIHNDPYGGPWHWSVYASRKFLENFKLILQFSRDHTILETTLTTGTNGDPQEAMDGRANWMWMCKVEYGF